MARIMTHKLLMSIANLQKWRGRYSSDVEFELQCSWLSPEGKSSKTLQWYAPSFHEANLIMNAFLQRNPQFQDLEFHVTLPSESFLRIHDILKDVLTNEDYRERHKQSDVIDEKKIATLIGSVFNICRDSKPYERFDIWCGNERKYSDIENIVFSALRYCETYQADVRDRVLLNAVCEGLTSGDLFLKPTVGVDDLWGLIMSQETVDDLSFVIVGRFHGDDDDTALVIKAPDLATAVSEFKDTILQMNDVPDDYDATAEENSVYITNALVTKGVVSDFSRAEIETALSFSDKTNDPLTSDSPLNQPKMQS